MSMLLDPENISKKTSTKSQNRSDFHHSKKVIIAGSREIPNNSEKNKHSLGHHPALCQGCLGNKPKQQNTKSSGCP